MEKRVLGLLLTLLGAIGLIIGAVYFVNHTGSTYNIKAIAMYGILGIIFFTSGVTLIRSTRDVSQGEIK
jgi:predicted Na+-dependent transporter